MFLPKGADWTCWRQTWQYMCVNPVIFAMEMFEQFYHYGQLDTVAIESNCASWGRCFQRTFIMAVTRLSASHCVVGIGALYSQLGVVSESSDHEHTVNNELYMLLHDLAKRVGQLEVRIQSGNDLLDEIRKDLNNRVHSFWEDFWHSFLFHSCPLFRWTRFVRLWPVVVKVNPTWRNCFKQIQRI